MKGAPWIALWAMTGVVLWFLFGSVSEHTPTNGGALALWVGCGAVAAALVLAFAVAVHVARG